MSRNVFEQYIVQDLYCYTGWGYNVSTDTKSAIFSYMTMLLY